MINLRLNIDHYSTLIFDCDGVVLNSNKVKTQAFYQTALPYGEIAARALVDYHVANGGVSRYKKFNYFAENIAPDTPSALAIDNLLASYARYVQEGLLNCQIASDLHKLREKTLSARWMIVSGGDQSELRSIFAERKLAELFDGGIFGSPDTKDEILAREHSNGNIVSSALFLGDSKYDYQAAIGAGLDFVFLSAWSEVKDWEDWCQRQEIQQASNIAALAE